MTRPTRIAALTALAAAGLIALPGVASAADGPCYAPPEKPDVIAHVNYEGMQSKLFCYGPVTIKPGQNTIDFDSTKLIPNESGYITRFDPDLIYADPNKGTNGVPGVDRLHLHHSVWLLSTMQDPIWAAGEEKTVVQLPEGFGWRSRPTDTITVNHMIHNLFPTTDKVYLTWKVDFVPDSSPAAATIKPATTLWLDAAGLKAYPVFDAKRGMGSGGTYTFPDQTTNPVEKKKIGPRASYTSPRDMTLLQTFGHLHPGGLKTNLSVVRSGVKKSLFDSHAQYWEPAGAVSWDVAMTGTPPDWRVKVKRGDTLKVSGTYDVSKASWYESMAIMPVAVYTGTQDVGGVDPYVTTPPETGQITHGHLPENDNHGGQTATLNDFTKLWKYPNARKSSGTTVGIRDFAYKYGDMSATGKAARPPTVRPGQALRFYNYDSTGNPNTDFLYHTVTACAAPCNKNTGIAYPLANGPVDFDSGELGFGPFFASPTAQRRSWTTPKNLKAGTYTYFCRVHPFMRGAFRVVR